MKKEIVFLKNILHNFWFPDTKCIYINTEYWPEHSLNNTQTLELEATKRCSMKRGVLEISQNSQENTCARASFLIKLPKGFLWIFLRTPFLQNTSGRLFLQILENNFVRKKETITGLRKPRTGILWTDKKPDNPQACNFIKI